MLGNHTGIKSYHTLYCEQVERAEAECERLKQGIPIVPDGLVLLCVDPVEQERLRKDAERYRWLRCYLTDDQRNFIGLYGPWSVSDVDAAIDAAIEASK